MGGDRLRPSLFARVPEAAWDNIPLLLDFIYGELSHRVSILETQLKGRLGLHEGDISRMDKRLGKVETCPCAVHRDPAHTCVILDLRDQMAEIKVGMNQQLSPLKIKIASILGGLAVLAFIADLMVRLLPYLRG